MSRPNTIKLIVWIISFQLIGFLLGLITQANIDPWYESLNKSSLNPPGFVFAIVWTVLYLVLAVIGWHLSNQRQDPTLKQGYHLFLLQMFMNWAWTPLFFYFHLLKLSAFWLIALTLLNCILIIRLKRKQRIIVLLLLPYTLWLIFATYLNLSIAAMN